MMTYLRPGRVMCRNLRQALAPSIEAASYCSTSMPEAGHHQDDEERQARPDVHQDDRRQGGGRIAQPGQPLDRTPRTLTRM